MTWREIMRGPGSFRGAFFTLTQRTETEGRRLVTHEHPGIDGASYDDLGRKAMGIRVSGYVVGEDYLDQLARIREACRTVGSGELRLPGLPPFFARCESFEVTGQTTEGGKADLSMVFLEDAGLVLPEVSASLSGAVEAARQTLTAATEDTATATIDTSGPGVLTRALATLSSGVSTARSAVDYYTSKVLSVPEYFRKLDAIAAAGVSLLSSPADLVAAVADCLGEIVATREALLAVADAYATLPEVISSSPTQARKETNDRALALVWRQTALAIAVEAASLEVYTTADEGVVVRDDLAERIDAELEIDDLTADAKAAWLDLRSAMHADISGRVADLPRLTTYTPPGVTSIHEVSQRLYGTSTRAEQILALNPTIQHPGFVPPITLTVLSR